MGSVKGKERAKEAKRWEAREEHQGSWCRGIQGGGNVLSRWVSQAKEYFLDLSTWKSNTFSMACC